MFRAVALLAVLVAVAPAADDKPFASKDGKFTAKFPAPPKEQTQEAAGVKMTMFAVEQKAGGFMAAYADMPIPENETAEQTEGRLDGARDGMVKNINAKLTDEKKVKLGGKHPGREVFADLPQGKGAVRARVYLVGTRMYQIMVIGTKDFVAAKAATDFLDSLELTK